MAPLSKYAVAFAVAAAVYAAQQKGCTPTILLVDPPVAADGLHVLIVREASQQTPDMASLVNSMVWRERVKELGGQVRVIDPTAPPENAVYAAAVQGVAVPTVIVSKKPGGGEVKPLADLTPADILALVNKWGA